MYIIQEFILRISNSKHHVATVYVSVLTFYIAAMVHISCESIEYNEINHYRVACLCIRTTDSLLIAD